MAESTHQSFTDAARLSYRLLKREWRAGELRVLLAALIITVASITAVSLFTDRMERAMEMGANELLASDMLVTSSLPIDAELEQEAIRRGLATARILGFGSVVVVGDRFQLAAVKAVNAGYPLRGAMRVTDAPFAEDQPANGIPAPGSVWLDARLVGILGIAVGDALELGAMRLRVSRILSYEPDRGGDLFAIAPRLLMNLADVPATELVQRGSRVEHRLLFAGAPQTIEQFRSWLSQRLKIQERIEGVRDARPELRTALDRANQFLGLAALVSVLLAGIAIAVAARRHAERHLDGAALLRCMGASQATVMRVYTLEVLGLGVIGSALGSLLGYVAQALIAQALGNMILAELPAPSWLPLVTGSATGLAVLVGFALPPIARLRKVSPARVLRRDLGPLPAATIGGYAIAVALSVGLIAWHAKDARLAAYVIGAGTGTVVALCAIAYVLIRLLNRLRQRVGTAWRFGLANITRRARDSVMQMVAFGLGIMMLLLISLVRGDLLAAWRDQLPPDAPNYFLINVQPGEMPAVKAMLAEYGRTSASFYPMVRGRLVAINDKPVRPDDYADSHAQRHVDRDFNLSWSAEPGSDNRIVEGRWWSRDEFGKPVLSVEVGFGESLGFRIGDALTFQIGGELVTATVQSMRSVEWDSFRVNFFVMAPPGLLESYPATYITSFYLPDDRRGMLIDLVRRFPSVTIIDVDALLAKVREIMERADQGMRYVFLFTLLAGFTVLLAAIQSTLDERRHESAILRTLGADRSDVRRGLLAEFLTLGALAGGLAALAATLLSAWLAAQVFHFPYQGNAWVWLAGVLGGSLGIGIAGLLGTRTVLRHPPMESLRRL
ncbi:MAG: FtsX-like permease family protein [Gammaproteobacteria bacterium]|nr:MAG: FtsX-like permease family protein [Gammaproteobacteria bacterium]